MEIVDNALHLGPFITVTIGIVVLFIGRRLNQKIDFLRKMSIPEPVSGGILVSLLIAAIYAVTSIEVSFSQGVRDALLVYFFTTVGLNARVSDLVKGGKPLVILLGVTILYMVIQNVVGISAANLLGLEPVFGLLTGSVSLIGGHGTAIAWAPKIAEEFGISNAMEIGLASATCGLILASIIGGPIAKYLITSQGLSIQTVNDAKSKDAEGRQDNGKQTVSSYEFLDAILAIHVSIVFGFLFHEGLAQMGLQLPLFVPCLLSGLALSNLIPDSYPRLTGLKWPKNNDAVDLIANISLGTFLSMSLMSIQIWTLVDLAGSLFVVLAAQLFVSILVNVYLVFRLMGKDYDAAVICAGFGGISLGSTPTAMANMSAVCQKYGHSQKAFVIVPLVCAFFIDLVNALLIPQFMGLL